MKQGFVVSIEEETRSNTAYRRVLYTASHTQLVVMSLMPGEEIGEEVHDLDQFIRIEAGTARVLLNGTAHEVSEDWAVVIPEGVRHNVVNIGSEPLKLYSLYSPPEHRDKTVHATKAQAVEEHFDGITSEA